MKGTKHREASRLCAYCGKMQILNWADQDGKPGIAQGYAQGISIRFFQLKVSEFLTTRPHGHVDS